jgi:predicted ArsR family transcriptional regulator
MMKKNVPLPTHEQIIDFLKTKQEPVSVNKIAKAFSVSRNAALVRIATLTFENPLLAEDEHGRIYLKKDVK